MVIGGVRYSVRGFFFFFFFALGISVYVSVFSIRC